MTFRKLRKTNGFSVSVIIVAMIFIMFVLKKKLFVRRQY